MMEALTQNTINEINLVDFAIACIRGLRNLKESQMRGEIDTVTYLHIMQDMEWVINRVTHRLLFIF